jgi:uncharacterized protein YukE
MREASDATREPTTTPVTQTIANDTAADTANDAADTANDMDTTDPSTQTVPLTFEELTNLPKEQLDKLEAEAAEQVERATIARRILTLRAKADLLEQGDETGDVSVVGSEPRGSKRPRADTIEEREPPKLKMDRYKGRSIKEYDAYMTRLTYHFRRYSHWYESHDPDTRKIEAAVEILDDDPMGAWRTHEEDAGGIEGITWQDYQDFLLSLIKDPEMLHRDANQKYSEAAQKDHQSVREFARYLQLWESRLPYQYTESQRKDHLRSKVLRAVRNEALKYPNEPKTYDGFIAHLQKIEDNMATRWTSRKAGRQDKRFRPPPDRRNTKSDNRGSDKQAKYCTYCKKTNHIVEDCRTKRYHERNQEKANVSKN